MADKEVLFSRAFRGYKRSDVNKYIAAENRNFAEKSATFMEEKKQLEAALAEKDSLIVALSEKLSELESESGSNAEKLAESEKALAEARAALELAERKMEEKLKRLEENLVSDQVSHEAELAQVREECREKLEEHDAELEKIREEYRLKEESRYDDVVRAAYRLRDKMAAQLRKFTKNCLREVMSGVDGMRSGADQASRSAESHGRRMNDSIDYYEESMKNEVRRILEEFKNGDIDRTDR